MLIIILAEDGAFFESLSRKLKLIGHNVIRYRDAVKLADNIPELRPDYLIVRVADYPLHWELLAAELAFLEKSSSGFKVLACFPKATLPSSSPVGAVQISEEALLPFVSGVYYGEDLIPAEVEKIFGAKSGQKQRFGLQQSRQPVRKKGLVALAKSRNGGGIIDVDQNKGQNE